MLRSELRKQAKRRLFGEMIAAIQQVGRVAGTTPRTTAELIHSIDNGRRVFDKGFFGQTQFDALIDLLRNDCSDADTIDFEDKWDNIEVIYSSKSDHNLYCTLHLCQIDSIFVYKAKPHRFWKALSEDMWEFFYPDDVFDFMKNGSAENINEEIKYFVGKPRYLYGEAVGLRNALIIMYREFRSGLFNFDVNRRRSFLSSVYAALDLAGLLGHRRSLIEIDNVLADLLSAYPNDLFAKRLCFDCRGIMQSHFRMFNKRSLTLAKTFHGNEIRLMTEIVKDINMIDEFPLLFTGLAGAYYNGLNVAVELNATASQTRPLIQNLAELEALIGNKIKVKDESYSTTLDPIYVRLNANVSMSGFDGYSSARVKQSEHALALIENIISYDKNYNIVSKLEMAKLQALKAKVLLYIHDDIKYTSVLDEYTFSKLTAIRLYESSDERAMSKSLMETIRKLENDAGLGPV